MAEATLVAPEETQVPQTEELSSPPAPESVETPPEVQADEEPNLESAHDEFLAKIGATEDASVESEPGQKPLSPEAQAEVDRVLTQTQAAAERATRELGVLNSFRDNATTLRTWSVGKLTPQDTEALVAFFRDYHGVSGQIHRAEASEAAATEAVNGFYDALSKELPANKRQAFLNARGTEHKSYADTVKAAIATAREGYVSTRDLTKAKADAVNEYKAFLIEKKLLKGHDAPPANGGSGVSSVADDAKLGDPDTPISEIMAIRARQRAAGL